VLLAIIVNVKAITVKTMGSLCFMPMYLFETAFMVFDRKKK
jgi:hypothetical protein